MVRLTDSTLAACCFTESHSWRAFFSPRNTDFKLLLLGKGVYLINSLWLLSPCVVSLLLLLLLTAVSEYETGEHAKAIKMPNVL